jgi:hypothetical protein
MTKGIDIIKGQYLNGMINGQVKYRNANGSTYEGHCENDQPNGKGKRFRKSETY